jgi:hypothetical protein
MVAFTTIKVGDVLWDCHKVRQGNTTVRKMGAWQVRILEIDPERRSAMASWNGNRPMRYSEGALKRLRRTKHPSVR